MSRADGEYVDLDPEALGAVAGRLAASARRVADAAHPVTSIVAQSPMPPPYRAGLIRLADAYRSAATSLVPWSTTGAEEAERWARSTLRYTDTDRQSAAAIEDRAGVDG